jgi:hypothetical protein
MCRPLQLLLVAVTAWLDRREREVLAYLIEENRVLRRQLGGRRLRLTDDDRRRLAVRAVRVGRRGLREIATIVTADTLLRWHRHLIARKWTYAKPASSRRGVFAEIRRFQMLAYAKPGCDTALHIAVPANGQLGELAEISERLARLFSWEPAEATLFVVCSHVPAVTPIRVAFHEDMRLRARSRITLVIDPTCTPQEVAAHYQSRRKRVFGRIRRLTPQLAGLAQFAIEHDHLPWPEQMQSWNASRSSSRRDRRYRDVATFRRDCEQALTRLRDLRLAKTGGRERSARSRCT